MGKESGPKHLPDGSVNVWSHLTESGRDSIDMGENYDGTHTTLPGYVEIDGIQMTAERLNKYLDDIAELEKKDAPESEYYGVMGIIRRFLGS